jgi:predicted MFS family arabinose efflux permease
VHIGSAIVGTICGPFVGRFVDRFGPRKVGSISAFACALGFVAISFLPGNLILFIAAKTFLALLGAGTSIITYIALISLWFDRARGMAIGIILAGSGICAIIAPKLLIPFVAEAGWRAGYRVVAIVLLISVPIILIGAHRPRDKAQGAKADEPVEQPGVSLGEALRTSRFWRQGIAIALMGFGLAGLYSHLVPMLSDRGIGTATAANLAALFGGAVFAGRLLAGYLLDRMFAPILATIFVLIAVTGLGSALVPDGGVILAAVAAFCIGISFGTELDIAGYLTGRYFGRKAFGAIFGFQFSFFTTGAIFSSLSYGMIYDATGNYDGALIMSMLVMLTAIPLLLSLGRYPEWKAAQAG